MEQHGVDAGGVRRDWLSRLSEQLFDPKLNLVIAGFHPFDSVQISPFPEFGGLSQEDQKVCEARRVKLRLFAWKAPFIKLCQSDRSRRGHSGPGRLFLIAWLIVELWPLSLDSLWLGCSCSWDLDSFWTLSHFSRNASQKEVTFCPRRFNIVCNPTYAVL